MLVLRRFPIAIILPIWENNISKYARTPMKINHWGRVRQFIRKYPAAEKPLKLWKRSVIEARWTKFSDVKHTFNSADWFEKAIIFDIAGNNIRLVAVCRFDLGRLYIDKVMIHEEYDKGLWKQRYSKNRK
jgi:mRNA interferase HigB